VWRALTDAAQFGSWFGVKFTEGAAFKAGTQVEGKVTHPGYDHLTWAATIERIEPERLFAYRWHPYAVDSKVDYSKEPTTLVEFHLEEAKGGVEVTVVESGFDHVPLARRAEAYRMNSQGWAAQMENLERYVSAA
jgi:uncharacterized protein YndB with AHSA1/START domain